MTVELGQDGGVECAGCIVCSSYELIEMLLLVGSMGWDMTRAESQSRGEEMTDDDWEKLCAPASLRENKRYGSEGSINVRIPR